MFYNSYEFLLLLLVSLLNVVVFSTVYSSGPTADDIHDDAILTAFLLLLASILRWRSYWSLLFLLLLTFLLL
jgi:hypothetical protein